MFGKTPHYLPEKDIAPYRRASACLYLFFFFVLVYGTLSFVFPYEKYRFDFNNPDATKNTLFEPHLSDFAPVEKGKVPAAQSLVLYAHNPHILEGGDITLNPSEDSSHGSLEGSQVKVRRGYAASFFPHTEELDISAKNLVEYEGNFYEQKENILSPFVSQEAAESWVPKSQISSLTSEQFLTFSLSDELIGFRPGTLLAYADGVFIVTEEATIRPFGSAEILLRFGYSFDHVITASGEDVGIYKRGKILLTNELHPAGTLFFDTDTQTTFLWQGKALHPLTPAYGEFLSAKNDRVNFSSQALQQESACSLHKKFLRNAYSCTFALPSQAGIGYDYQVSLVNSSEEVDIQYFQAGLQSSRKNENARATAHSLFNRVLERVGLY